MSSLDIEVKHVAYFYAADHGSVKQCTKIFFFYLLNCKERFFLFLGLEIWRELLRKKKQQNRDIFHKG